MGRYLNEVTSPFHIRVRHVGVAPQCQQTIRQHACICLCLRHDGRATRFELGDYPRSTGDIPESMIGNEVGNDNL